MIGPRWQSKPPLGYGIDREHPLAAGLVACLAFNAGSGPPTELLSGTQFAMSGTTTWSSSPYGLALGSDGSTGSAPPPCRLLTIRRRSRSPRSASDIPGDGQYYRIVEKGANNESVLPG